MKRVGDHEWTFDRARPEDGDAMLQLALDAYGAYVERMGREPAPMTADYKSIAASGDALLVHRDGRLLGMLVTRVEDDALLIENVAVGPDAQGSGLGSALLAEAERIAHRSGIDRIRLYTNEAMSENLTYYPRRGYRETDRRTEDGYRRVYFEKQLDA